MTQLHLETASFGDKRKDKYNRTNYILSIYQLSSFSIFLN